MDEEIDLGLQVEHGILQIRDLALHVRLPNCHRTLFVGNALDGLLHLLDLRLVSSVLVPVVSSFFPNSSIF